MALSQNESKNIQREQSGLLDINANKYYFETLRPALIEFNKTYHTDRELNRTIVEVMNKADSAAMDQRINDLAESYENLLSCVNSKNYMISGPMRYGTEAEKSAVKDLVDKFNDLTMILKYEKPSVKENQPIKERLNYQPPNGGFMGYNLDDLSNRGPRQNKERIPNPTVLKEKYPY